MKQTFATALLSIFSALNSYSQTSKSVDHFYINDEIAEGNLFNPVDSKMIDTNSIRFLAAKENVLDYCNKHLSFRMDSAASYYSCREYFQANPYTSESNRKRMQKKQLKYEFFITFSVNPTIDYHLYFYLDSLMQVKDASEDLFKIKKERIQNILPWNQISDQVLEKEKDYIIPLGEIDLEYDPTYKRFVYMLIQLKTEKTNIHKTSDYTGDYDLNMLIVDSETGTVLEKTKAHYSYISEPSW
ncbi:hypothetical protein [Fluviicola sp.]|uniref:hypothetical protein n=1 Tax=Fluviicola sp. TaxID=1917219 RepID=UPI0031DE2FC2